MASLDNSGSQVYSSVKDYYGKVLQSSKDLKTSACTAGSAPNPVLRSIIAKIPHAVNDKFYGCGNPIPLGITGKDILDLGSGSGRDCYIAAALVGPQGSVTGVDMTDEQLETARQSIPEYADTLGYQPRLKFLTGYIEMLQEAGVANESIDICISNCVINLSPNKRLVLEGVYQALRPGGELYFSDVYADAQLPEAVRTHDVLLGECIGGALYTEEFEQIAKDIGFFSPRALAVSHIEVHDAELKALVGDVKFYSITYRLFKPAAVPATAAVKVPEEEAYVSTATYLGTIEGHEELYELDVDNVFKKNVPNAISPSTADILSSSWLAPFFTLKFDATGQLQAPPAQPTSTVELMQKAYKDSTPSTSGCCPPKNTSGCCPPKDTSGCCPPKNASSGCCPPKSTSSGCCPPKNTSGCCPPKKTSSGCCPPASKSAEPELPKLEILNADGGSDSATCGKGGCC
ncbi:hypothetical protein GGI07_005597 [Coemansia sp. Benny D115]|nr:hypothetical protein GGI07_005597 [Coemansia sp. Benny D115]